MTFSTLVSAQVLSENYQRSDWVIFDCRFSLSDRHAGLKAYQAGHIPGARYVDLEDDLSSEITATSGRHPLPDPALLAQKLSVWGVNDQTQIVIYDDQANAFAARMWWLLKWLGHVDVACLDGGLEAWRELELPVLTDRPDRIPGNFSGTPDSERWVDSELVLSQLGDSSFLVIDARAEARYLGNEEPIDPVAGHVPEACNRPYVWNLDERGYFLLPSQLHQQYQSLLDGIEPGNVIHMCGSGVTACHNVLAMEVAGIYGSKLYAGSWSEWIKNAERPVVQGH